ncbi:toxin glutamine deamidase domain-containing protein [Spirillospora sp. NPDC052242]
MIVPDHVLSIMSGVNPDAVEAEAHDLKKAATGIRETGANVHSTWQGLSAFYEAPEAADLFSATAPVRDDAASFAGQLEKVTGALTTYAAETRVIKRKLTDLYMQAVTFVNKTYAEKEDWRKNEDLVQENNSLLQAVDAQALAFQQAQEKASASIYSAYGGSAPKRTMCTDDKPLTWGTPEEAENPWYEDMWDGATSFLTGFFGDGLWGDASGLWDLATSPEKWRESFENLMILGTPAISLLSPKLRGKFGETWKGFGKSFVAWDQWKQDPARALGNTAYNIVTTIIPIGKAGSAGKLAKGTRATAKVGEALDPLSLTLRAGARLPKVSDIAAQLTHKFGDLGTKLKLDLTRTKIITPQSSNTPTPTSPSTPEWNEQKTHTELAESLHPSPTKQPSTPAAGAESQQEVSSIDELQGNRPGDSPPEVAPPNSGILHEHLYIPAGAPGAGPIHYTRRGDAYETPLTTELKKLVNPLNGQNNCQSCALAVDKAHQGIPLTAIPHPRPPDNTLLDDYVKGNWHHHVSLSGVVLRMKTLPEGARGIVLGFGDDSHAFNVRKVRGVIQFLDAQQGVARPFRYNEFFFARTDNL